MNYSKCFVEVDEILKHLPQDCFNKIPKDIIEIIREHRDKSYIWKYNINKKLKDQDIDDSTVAILTFLNMEYLLNEEQKNFVSSFIE